MTTTYHSENNIQAFPNELDKNIYKAVFSTSLLLYTFFNVFTLTYISNNQGLNNTVLGLCIYYNVIYTALLAILFKTYIQRFFLISLAVYVLNTCASFIVIGVVNSNNEPLIYNIIYALISTAGICVVMYKRHLGNTSLHTAFYDAV